MTGYVFITQFPIENGTYTVLARTQKKGWNLIFRDLDVLAHKFIVVGGC